ncbi:MAG TPA: hypothetical protein VHC86_00645 [Opitutaceae bacterium]|nr:hypothetical protein [Opitutaceae bacterium]
MKLSTMNLHRIASALLYASIIAGLILAFVSPHGTAANPAAALTHLSNR